MESEASVEAVERRNSAVLFLASFVALFFELLVIRYLSTEIRVFAYLKNLPLIACFLGIGLGMIRGRQEQIEKYFPWATLVLFAVIRLAPQLHLTHIGYAEKSYALFGNQGFDSTPVLSLVRYLVLTVGLLALITVMFVALGGLVGEELRKMPSLRGYGVNLAGSLAGILTFTLLSYLVTPPVVWVIVGSAALLPFFTRKKLVIAVLVCVVAITAVPERDTYWSPYYRIDFSAMAPVPGEEKVSAYVLSVNHDYHQKVLNLSKEFVSQHPNAEPNRSALSNYELPYQLVERPESVLIVGAGTGNDVAAALRHGATTVDAVEIDPVILRLGRRFHPEQPYANPKVSVHVNDARAYFNSTKKKYDLVVFAYLDSHTMFSSFSSLRLDNYVYTLESFQAARKLLKPNGTMILSFVGGTPFVNERLYAMLDSAFGEPPVVVNTGYDGSGNSYVEGAAKEAARRLPYPEISAALRKPDPILATDSWPFLYLDHRAIPNSMIVLLIAIIIATRRVLKSALGGDWVKNVEYRQMFFLGAAFMLLETKGITQLSLLFGSTWTVNAAVIATFLTMGFVANLWVMRRSVSLPISYGLLFAALVAGAVISPARFSASSDAIRLTAGCVLVGLPVLFSGIVFSSAFKSVPHPEKALAVNLFGAIAGGILENVVMLGGITSLSVLAVLLYAGACFSSFRRESVVEREAAAVS